MYHLNDIYTSAYGTNAKVFLRSIGGNPDAIINDLAAQCAAPNPLADMLGVSSAATAEDAHNAILREIVRIYFSGVSRESAVAVANALADFGTISLCATIPELTFNAAAYVRAWNNSNPSQNAIVFCA